MVERGTRNSERGTGNAGRCFRSALRVPRSAFLLLVLLPLLGGCQGFGPPFDGGSVDDDPLRPGGQIPSGDVPPPPQPIPPTAPLTTQATTQTPTPNPMAWAPPTAPTGNTPASMTATAVRPMDPVADPRANGPQPDSAGWQSPSLNTGGGAQLRPIETADVGSRPQPLASASGVTQVGGTQQPDNLEQCFALLKSYGMNYMKATLVNSETDEYNFTCSIPNKQNPKVGRMYDGNGIGQLGAMRAVLAQIAAEQGGK